MTVNIVEEDYQNANMAILNQCSQILDQRLEELYDIVNQLVSNQYVQNFKNYSTPFVYPNSYRINEVRNNLYNFNISNKFLLNYFLLFNNSKLAINNTIVYKYNTFYKHYFYYLDIPYDIWYQNIIEGKYNNGFLETTKVSLLNQNTNSLSPNIQDTQYNVITYIQPLLSTNTKAGYVILLVDNKEITEMLSAMNISNGGYAYIVNKENDIISYISSEEDSYKNEDSMKMIQNKISNISNPESGIIKMKFNGVNMMVSYVISPTSGFKYIAMQPTKVVLAKAEYIKYSMLIYLSVSLLFGIIISIFLARKISKPVIEIVESIPLSAKIKKSNTFMLIKKAILDLTMNIETLNKSIDMQKPFLKASLVGRLLKGEFNSEDQINRIIKYVGINIPRNSFCVIIFKYYEDLTLLDEININELNKFKLIIKRTIDFLLGKDSFYYDIDEDKIVLLLNCNSQNIITKNILDLIINIKEHLPKASIKKIIISVGGIVNGFMQIPRSYEQARMSLGFNLSSIDEKVIFFDKLNIRDEAYYFPHDVRVRLINSVKTGDKAVLKQLLQQLFKENIQNQSLPLNLQKMFIYDLLINAVRLANLLSLSEDKYQKIIKSLAKIEQLSDNKKFDLLTETYCLLCDNVLTQIKHHHANTLDKIKVYIQNTYINADLSLSKVSDKFNISEAYLSHIFKQYTGQNFSVYVENLRMDKARELITNTKLPIREVALRVGYYSTNTFCRVFKRVHSFSATTLR